MASPDARVLLYVHNNPPAQHATVVAPIAAALRHAFDGQVLVCAHTDVRVHLGRDPRVIVDGTPVLPGRTFARLFASPHGAVLARALEALGSRVVNPTTAAAAATSKFHSAALFAAAGLPVPEQQLLPPDPGQGRARELAALGWPVVLKADKGMRGQSVWQVADPAAVAERASAGNLSWVGQQFRADAGGQDLRVLVVGGQVVGAMRRRAAPGDFRANLAQGGTAEPAALEDAEADVAVAAAAALGLVVAGVDLLRTEDGPLLLEANPNPGLTGLVAATGDPSIYDRVAAAVVSA